MIEFYPILVLNICLFVCWIAQGPSKKTNKDLLTRIFNKGIEHYWERGIHKGKKAKPFSLAPALKCVGCSSLFWSWTVNSPAVICSICNPCTSL